MADGISGVAIHVTPTLAVGSGYNKKKENKTGKMTQTDRQFNSKKSQNFKPKIHTYPPTLIHVHLLCIRHVSTVRDGNKRGLCEYGIGAWDLHECAFVNVCCPLPSYLFKTHTGFKELFSVGGQQSDAILFVLNPS